MNSESGRKTFRLGCAPILGLVAAAVLISALVTAWWVKSYLYASKFTPTQLSAKEQSVLEAKLNQLESSSKIPRSLTKNKPHQEMARLEPEPYTEEGASREVSLTERELNALVANQPEVAQRVAIDLSEDLVSVKLVVPMDEEILFLGGKTLRLKLGMVLRYDNGRPVVALQGVTLGGIPLPNAWLGGLKYKNLTDEFGDDGGFWKIFSQGVENIHVEQGHIRIELKE